MGIPLTARQMKKLYPASNALSVATSAYTSSYAGVGKAEILGDRMMEYKDGEEVSESTFKPEDKFLSVGTLAFGTPDKKTGQEYLYVLDRKTTTTYQPFTAKHKVVWKPFMVERYVESQNYDPGTYYKYHLARDEIEDRARELDKKTDDEAIDAWSQDSFWQSLSKSKGGERFEFSSTEVQDMRLSLLPVDIRKMAMQATSYDEIKMKSIKLFTVKSSEKLRQYNRVKDIRSGVGRDIYIASELAKGNDGKPSAISQPVNKILNKPMRAWNVTRYKLHKPIDLWVPKGDTKQRGGVDYINTSLFDPPQKPNLNYNLVMTSEFYLPISFISEKAKKKQKSYHAGVASLRRRDRKKEKVLIF